MGAIPNRDPDETLFVDEEPLSGVLVEASSTVGSPNEIQTYSFTGVPGEDRYRVRLWTHAAEEVVTA